MLPALLLVYITISLA